MISILIATKNRPQDLHRCISSILKSTYTNFEIVVIDQSDNDLSHKALLSFPKRNIRYIKHTARGKSDALNQGIQNAKGDILAFTDDDCIAPSTWLGSLNTYLINNMHIDGVLGSTYPYLPTRHSNTVCPSTFTNKHRKIITKPGYHVSNIGFGNNMAIRKSTLLRIDGFRNWIGPNTYGPAAEDAEIELRILVNGGSLAYEPKIRLYHNRWLSPHQLRVQDIKYTRGEAVCYAYYFFQSYRFSRSILLHGIMRHVRICKKALVSIIKLGPSRHTLGSIYWAVATCASYAIGVGIGAMYAVRYPLKPTTV